MVGRWLWDWFRLRSFERFSFRFWVLLHFSLLSFHRNYRRGSGAAFRGRNLPFLLFLHWCCRSCWCCWSFLRFFNDFFFLQWWNESIGRHRVFPIVHGIHIHVLIRKLGNFRSPVVVFDSYFVAFLRNGRDFSPVKFFLGHGFAVSFYRNGKPNLDPHANPYVFSALLDGHVRRPLLDFPRRSWYVTILLLRLFFISVVCAAAIPGGSTRWFCFLRRSFFVGHRFDIPGVYWFFILLFCRLLRLGGSRSFLRRSTGFCLCRW
mmetsp:Transcript_5438/g.12930  ORF Transcript_5438/g.12930 Transcript_5438/m.12930 type:complete len:262 (+) Transcript_5438:2979-3764(+)